MPRAPAPLRSPPPEPHLHSHDEWCKPLPGVKAFPKAASLAAAQVTLDRQRLGKQPALLERKWKRMAGSPFAFLRGAGLLFDECLRREGSFASGPSGGGSLVGDCHLENFGTFRTAAGQAVFHVNDFDALRDGPWRFDVLRLLTSVLLARPELRVSGSHAQHLAEQALEGHQRAISGSRVAAPLEIRALCRAAAATHVDRLLKKHVEGRRLVRDDKHPPAGLPMVKRLPEALAQWALTVPTAQRPTAAQLKLLDVRRRISGTGSLGAERFIALLAGSSGDGPWLVDVKEVDFSAERVVEAQRGAVHNSPALLGYAELGAHEMVLHRLMPGEEKLSLEKLEDDAVDRVIRHLGALTGEVHRRLARTTPAQWSPKERKGLLDSARRLAVLHEEAFLEFCALCG